MPEQTRSSFMFIPIHPQACRQVNVCVSYQCNQYSYFKLPAVHSTNNSAVTRSSPSSTTSNVHPPPNNSAKTITHKTNAATSPSPPSPPSSSSATFPHQSNNQPTCTVTTKARGWALVCHAFPPSFAYRKIKSGGWKGGGAERTGDPGDMSRSRGGGVLRIVVVCW